jgi:hypothetical protein
LTTFSQKGTDTIPEVKCFPIPVVKEMIKDLISGDSAKVLLKETEKELIKCGEKSYYQDSVMNTQSTEIRNLNGVINDERVKYGILEDHSKKLEKAVAFEKFKNKCTLWVSGAAVLIVGVVVAIIK